MSKIERIKANTDIRRIISSYIEVRQVGNYLTACCPFHEEKTPSFRVYDDHYHCYGCGAHGDSVDFVCFMEGVGVRRALKIMQGNHGENRMEPRNDLHEKAEREAQKAKDKEERLALLRKMAKSLEKRTPEEGFPYFGRKGFQYEPVTTLKSSFLNEKIFGCNATGDSEKSAFIPIFRISDLKVPTLELIAAQYITEAGKKLFHKGLPVKEGFHPISLPWRNWLKDPYTDLNHRPIFSTEEFVPVILVEGYATGLAVREALSEVYRGKESHVIVTFSASNMEAVGKRFVKQGFESLLCFADGDKVGVQSAKRIEIPFVFKKDMDAADLFQTDFDALKNGVLKLLQKMNHSLAESPL